MMRWLVVLLILMAGKAEAGCLLMGMSGVAATQTFSSGTGEYKPYDSATYAQEVTVTVNALVNVGTCQFFVALKAGQSGNASARKLSTSPSLNYQVYSDAAMSSVLLPAVVNIPSANIVASSFGTNVGLTQTGTLKFYWTIPPQQILAANASRYSDAGVTLELYEGTPAAYILRDSVNMTFRSKVESSVDISIASSGGTYGSGSNAGNVNFGTPVTGAQRSFDLSVRSNDGYLVTLTSAKKQKLERTTSSTIPYTMTVSSAPVNLSGGTAVTVANVHGSTTPANGTNLPVTVTLGTVTGNEVAGTYQDVVSVGISAN